MEDAPIAMEVRDEDSHSAKLNPGTGLAYRDLPLTLAFIALFLVQLAHHNMWRDELNAFGIAVASPSLASLFHLIHYEGHPWLWYVSLWIVSKFTVFPWGMKVLEALIGIGIYLMLGLASPFSRWEKVLLFLGYFITFEYTVMVRMYGLLLLLALVYVRERTLHPERALRLGLLLGLMASTDALGVILSASLLAEYGYYLLKQRGGQSTTAYRQLAYTGLVYAALLAFAVYTVWVTPDISWRTNHPPLTFLDTPYQLLKSAVNYIVMPYFLAQNRHLMYFWSLPRPRPVLYSFCIPPVLYAYWLIFRGHKNLLLLMGLTMTGGILFGYLVYLGAARQFGIVFMAFLVAIWLMREESPRLPKMAYVLLGIMALSGIKANAGEWARPFSYDVPAAQWLRANHLDDGPLVGTPDTTASDIAELLHRPVYMLDCNCSESFLLFSKRRDQFTKDQVPDRLALAMKNLNVSSFVFLDAYPFTEKEQAEITGKGLTFTWLTYFMGAEAEEENFFIYRIAKAGNYTSIQP
jgi:hypothetical protein